MKSFPQGSRALRILESLGLPPDAEAADALLRFFEEPTLELALEELVQSEGLIGVWERTKIDGVECYRRSERLRGRWGQFASVSTFPVDPVGKRVVFLGESVARGAMLPATQSPARLLQRTLTESMSCSVEVLDLASHGCGPVELCQLLDQTPELDPDLVILFAGNNWEGGARRALLGSAAAHANIGYELTRGGFEAVAEGVGCRVAAWTQSVCDSIRSFREANDVPVMLVLPDFNLLDWEWDRAGSVSFSQSGASTWWRMLLEAFEGEAANDLAPDRLDGERGPGVSSTSANSLERRIHERDRRIWDFAEDCPRCSSITQDQIRELENSDIPVCDLPRIFRSANAGAASGRDYFLDYCHMNARATELAVGEIASIAMSQLGAHDAAKRVRCPRIPAAAAGESHLLAAIHNAHWGQPGCLVGHHLSQVCELHPKGTELLRRLATVLDQRVGPVFAKGAAELRELSPLIADYLPRLPTLDDALLRGEIELQVAMEEPSDLGGRKQGREMAPRERRPIDSLDLLDPGFRPSLRSRSWPSDSRAYFRSYFPRAVFGFDRKLCAASQLMVVLRSAPGFQPLGKAAILFDGSEIGLVDLLPSWQRIELELPRGGSDKAQIEFCWPEGSWERKGIEAAYLSRLSAGLAPDWGPAIADVADLRVSSAACASQSSSCAGGE